MPTHITTALHVTIWSHHRIVAVSDTVGTIYRALPDPRIWTGATYHDFPIQATISYMDGTCEVADIDCPGGFSLYGAGPDPDDDAGSALHALLALDCIPEVDERL